MKHALPTLVVVGLNVCVCVVVLTNTALIAPLIVVLFCPSPLSQSDARLYEGNEKPLPYHLL